MKASRPLFDVINIYVYYVYMCVCVCILCMCTDVLCFGNFKAHENSKAHENYTQSLDCIIPKGEKLGSWE